MKQPWILLFFFFCGCAFTGRAQSEACFKVNDKLLVIEEEKQVKADTVQLLGKSEKQIRKLLGEPDSFTVKKSENTATWYYNPVPCEGKQPSGFSLRITFTAKVAEEAVMIIGNIYDPD